MICGVGPSAELVAGSEVRQPFVITIGESDDVLSIDFCTVTAFIMVEEEELFALTLANGGLDIVAALPPPGSPHGFLVLSEEQSAQLPAGRVARARLQVIDWLAMTDYTQDLWLEVGP